MSDLITMEKGGEVIGVHSSCVEDHRRLGWVQSSAPLPAPIHEELPRPDNELVEIPADWADLHWKTQVALAEKISGRDDITKAEEAREIIAAEAARRTDLG